jgi:sugar lactone lactonase YvrE
MMVRCRALTGDRCGEGAVWDDADRALYWCDINRFLVHRFDEESASVKSWVFDEPVVAVALTQTPGQLLLAQASRLTQWWPASDMRRDVGFHLDDYPIARLNDGRADRQGNFWVGSMQNNVKSDGDLDHAVEGHWTLPGHGKLFRITRGGAHAVYRTEVGISNTVCWSPDGRTFYFGDSLKNEISSFDFDPAISSVGEGRPFFAGFHRGGPDGSAVDSQGYLWNCRFGGGCIVRVAPDGRLDRIVELPCTDVTTCTFGGSDLRTLYVTSASMRQHSGERLAGSLFSFKCEAPGLPENRAAI